MFYQTNREIYSQRNHTSRSSHTHYQAHVTDAGRRCFQALQSSSSIFKFIPSSFSQRAMGPVPSSNSVLRVSWQPSECRDCGYCRTFSNKPTVFLLYACFGKPESFGSSRPKTLAHASHSTFGRSGPHFWLHCISSITAKGKGSVSETGPCSEEDAVEPGRGHPKRGSGVTRHFVCSCPTPRHTAECHFPETLELLAKLQLRPSACVLTHTHLVYAYKDVCHTTIPWVLWSCVRGATRSPAENFGTQAAPREGMAQPPQSPSWWPCALCLPWARQAGSDQDQVPPACPHCRRLLGTEQSGDRCGQLGTRVTEECPKQ